ncbi:MAG: AAA family ATPase [Candidatus Moranbacteria bacterium]|nr:AAA family ATPase [Candidatus Moranbacteria bacterium]
MKTEIQDNLPWAEKYRPKTLSALLGQEHLTGKNKVIFNFIFQDNLPSMIFWGPPGCGKTTLANIIAQKTKSNFIKFSAATSGIPELRKILERAKEDSRFKEKTIIFIDEIHRFNKKQQDILLPHLEEGVATLIGATTENPSFEINSALLSRARVFVLKKIQPREIVKILEKILKKERIKKIAPALLNLIADLSNYDARVAINSLEILVKSRKKPSKSLVREIFQKSHLLYDKKGEEHYNLISALHKSMRVGDENASLYWLARMMEGGEEPLYIARRLIRFASEDIGLANNSALLLAVSTYQACHYLGYPECDVHLAHCVAYLAKSKKDVAVYKAVKKARHDVREFGSLEVPLSIRNAPTKLMKDLNYGKDYVYPPDYNYKVKKNYLPKELKKRKYL